MDGRHRALLSLLRRQQPRGRQSKSQCSGEKKRSDRISRSWLLSFLLSCRLEQQDHREHKVHGQLWSGEFLGEKPKNIEDEVASYDLEAFVTALRRLEIFVSPLSAWRVPGEHESRSILG